MVKVGERVLRGLQDLDALLQTSASSQHKSNENESGSPGQAFQHLVTPGPHLPFVSHTHTHLLGLLFRPCFAHYTVYQATSGRTSTVNGTRVIMTERAF
jgi:hypothetical protein